MSKGELYSFLNVRRTVLCTYVTGVLAHIYFVNFTQKSVFSVFYGSHRRYLRLGKIYDELLRYEIGETADVLVLLPAAGDGSVTEEEFLETARLWQLTLEQSGIFEKHLSVDEQIMAHYGRHSSKIFIRS
jgi:hypothetical protein